MLNTPYYIPPHTVSAFKTRVEGNLTTKEVRDIILSELQKKNLYDFQRYNHKIQPVYKGQYKNKTFLMPVCEEKEKKDAWDVVTTILLPDMKIYNSKKNKALSATDFAIEFDVDRSTVIEHILTNKIKTYKHELGKQWRIPIEEVKRYKREGIFIKPYKKWNKPYSETEIYIIVNNVGKSNEYISKLINRSENSVKIKRCRMRKEGYDV